MLKRKYILSIAAVTILILVQLIQSTEVQTKTLSAGHINSDSSTNFASITGGSTFWNINYSASWEDLHTYLPSGKMSGTAVWVKLVPPSKSPLYSEPYRNDYIRWAQEIARLSLRYSNLKGYSIENLQDNIDSGYLTQNYVDSMKAVGIAINPKLQFIITDKTWKLFYVDKDAKGNGDGSSWANAATQIKLLKWSNIHAGDTIYISGGSISKTYKQEMLVGLGVTEGNVVITKGKDEGHKGKVIYSAFNNATYPYALRLANGCKNLKIMNITFMWDSITVGQNNGILSISSGTNIWIDSCYIKSNGRAHGILVESCKYIAITNNKIETLSNDYSNEQDGIQIYKGGGGHTIKGNTIILRGINSFPHRDGIQFSAAEGGRNYLQTIIANNFIFNNGQALYLSDVGSGRFLIYNNIIIDTANVSTSGTAFALATIDPTNTTTGLVYNNTIINKGKTVSSVGFCPSSLDTLIFKNNIILVEGGMRSVLFFGWNDYSGMGYMDFDYNQYYQGANAVRIDTNSSADHISFAQWQAMGYDIHSTTKISSFVKLWTESSVDYKMYLGSPGIDDGIDLSPVFNYDFEGTLRPQQKSWDKGAFELK